MKLRFGGLLFLCAVLLLGFGLLMGRVSSQGVANAVSLFYNGNYVPPAATSSPWPNATPVLAQGMGSSGAAAPIICDTLAIFTSITTSNPVVAGVANKSIYPCAWEVVNSGTAAGTYQWKASTAAASCTTPTVITPPVALTVDVPDHFGNNVGLAMTPTGPNLALCIVVAASGTMSGWVWYAQF